MKGCAFISLTRWHPTSDKKHLQSKFMYPQTWKYEHFQHKNTMKFCHWRKYWTYIKQWIINYMITKVPKDTNRRLSPHLKHTHCRITTEWGISRKSWTSLTNLNNWSKSQFLKVWYKDLRTSLELSITKEYISYIGDFNGAVLTDLRESFLQMPESLAEELRRSDLVSLIPITEEVEL